MKLFIAISLLIASTAFAQKGAKDYPPAATQPILPPLCPMPQLTRRDDIIVADNDPWITPCEATDFRESPSYDDTFIWLKKLVAAAPKQLAMVSLGKSPEGRDIWMIVASKEGNFDAKSLRASGKPIFLAQAGIHPGEIDGKDAGMMLLRDMTVRGNQKQLLDGANFLFVPIFNVDGHERRSPYTRSNQRGPEITGWRTNSRNLNLNRDYAKLDTPEVRAMVRAINEWDPDLYYDIHVTDGADYQYDITFGSNDTHAHSPEIAAQLNEMRVKLSDELRAAGNLPGPLVFPIDEMDFGKGLRQMTAEPRFSHGYGDARQTPSVLVENHALKPYDRRVLGTYVLLQATLELLTGETGDRLRHAIAHDRASRRNPVPLEFGDNNDPDRQTIMAFAGIEYQLIPSPITGANRVEWLGVPKTYQFPFLRTQRVVASAERPTAYYIPPAWNDVIERLKIHGIQMEKLEAPREIDVTMYRINDAKLMKEPFEGRVGIESCSVVAEKRHEKFVSGTVRVPTDQPLGELAMLLLEPKSPDSFSHWGFFNEILQRTEYIDGYIMEPMAAKMLAEDPKLAAEFQKKLSDDPEFAKSAAQRLDWFYQRTPFVDDRWKLYPVAREE